MTATESPRQQRAGRPKVRYVIAAVVCAAAVGWFLWKGLGENLVYLRTVSEAVAARESQGDSTFRMAGEVVPGSIERAVVNGAPTVTFAMTDGKASAGVSHRGDTPDLFEDGAPVVCEGHWVGRQFDCDRILIRHDNEYSQDYEAPTVSAPQSEATTK